MACRLAQRSQRKYQSRVPHTGTLALALFLAVVFSFQCAAAAESPSRGRLLTRAEGLAVLEVMSERGTSMNTIGRKPDCSHLVNEVYNSAGLAYPYAKSSDLYRGHPSFVRVKAPQPGDLIVWPGHVGLVTDPRGHLFYSSLRSGLDIEDYSSPYWKKHGIPRFYRYRITGNDTYVLTSERTTASAKSLPIEPLTTDEAREDSLNAGSGASLERPSSDRAADEALTTKGVDSSFPAQTVMLGRYKPTIERVSEAISELNQSVSSTADAESLLQSPATIVIFTELNVKRLEFKGSRGWVFITVSSNGLIREGELDKTIRHGEEHWELARSKTGWKVLVPPGALYLSRTAAARIFAQQLARLTASSESELSNSAASEAGTLASLLNGLLKN